MTSAKNRLSNRLVVRFKSPIFQFLLCFFTAHFVRLRKRSKNVHNLLYIQLYNIPHPE